VKSTKQVGELRLSNGGASGNGGVEAEAPANVSMVENSETSTMSGKPRTRRGAGWTQEQALEIMQQTVLNYRQSGRPVQIYNDAANNRLVIVLAGTALIDGSFTDTGNGGAE
jgi:hypothetical protein